jgi:hypothetical protein
VSALALSAGGRILASDLEGLTTVWSVASDFAQSTPLWKDGGGEGSVNVDVAPDGSRVAVSGDARRVFDTPSGQALGPPDPAPPPNLADLCIGTELRFSPDGRFVAGKHYGTTVDVMKTDDLSKVAELETYRCGQGSRSRRTGTGSSRPKHPLTRTPSPRFLAQRLPTIPLPVLRWSSNS